MRELDGGDTYLVMGVTLSSCDERSVLEARGPLGREYVVAQYPSHCTPVPPAAIVDRRLVGPAWADHTKGETRVRTFMRPDGLSVTEWLAAAGPPEVENVLQFGLSLCSVMESLHGSGWCALSLDPDLVFCAADLDAHLILERALPRCGEMPTYADTRTAAPEVVHGMPALCGLHSDVYAVAALLHALLAKRPLWVPPASSSTVFVHSWSPRVWRPELPLGIWPRLSKALHADPAQRLPHMAALRQALQEARTAHGRRQQSHAPVRVVDAWADMHMGVGKARRGGDQQDRVFCDMAEEGALALAAVADGVSHATVGDGGRAAQHTIESVHLTYQELKGARDAGRPPLPHDQLLAQTVDRATVAICRDVTENLADAMDDPAGVMASTLVMALFDRGMLTVLNCGDSRAYLFDGQVCEAITVDHDRRTEAIRAGMDPFSAAALDAAGALTRAVGRLLQDPDGVLHPVSGMPDWLAIPVLAGERIVLCSDGLTDYAVEPGHVPFSPTHVEEALAAVLMNHPGPAQATHALLGLANSNGGHDNIAVVVLLIGHAEF
jgi:serine/threonine protein phosphatase PrpC